MPAKFSEGQDEEILELELRTLLGNGWQLDAEGIRIEKTFYFKTYTKVLV